MKSFHITLNPCKHKKRLILLPSIHHQDESLVFLASNCCNIFSLKGNIHTVYYVSISALIFLLIVAILALCPFILQVLYKVAAPMT